jgi:hypothetical protein
MSPLPPKPDNSRMLSKVRFVPSATAAALINGWNTISCCQFDFLLEIVIRKGVSVEDGAAVSANMRQDRFDIRDVAGLMSIRTPAWAPAAVHAKRGHQTKWPPKIASF